ncbi:hypothetical protein DD902_13805 [Staphylococcus pseudintermedius]|uniref:Uncharacterized protein n=1 Tax=Staphylococcus pseudintermedius TaxID=283734 RepID=A0A317YM31_STAPS|nr:hypothetical protein [Staphylococcus pseudintermedius]PWZ71297.1 hypothetical protein DD902_13805 [Staphylococcus pseudintermedius]
MTKEKVKEVKKDREGNVVDTDDSLAIEMGERRQRQSADVRKSLNETQVDLQSNQDFRKTGGKIIENFTECLDFGDIFRS